MKTLLKIVVISAAFAWCSAQLSAASPGVQVEVQPSANNPYGYQLFLPKAYAASTDEKFPLIIFLHGSGERGADLSKVKAHGPPKIVDSDPNFPFIVVSPQAPEGEVWDVLKLESLLAVIQKNYRVDPSRLYLTGLSLGGFGTWDWAIARPGLFAAIAPICGRSDVSKAAALKGTPIWAFHGDNDDAVDMAGSFDMVTAVRKAGGDPHLTIYPDTGHDSWTRTYADPALYFWFLQHRLPETVPTMPKGKVLKKPPRQN
jgi:predicted peptidase